jgi:hypothetical protein
MVATRPVHNGQVLDDVPASGTAFSWAPTRSRILQAAVVFVEMQRVRRGHTIRSR